MVDTWTVAERSNMSFGRRIFLSGLLVAQLTACASYTSSRETEMYTKASQLTYITRAVVAYNGADRLSLDDSELVTKATVHDQSLLEGFGQNTFRTKWLNPSTAVVLLCNSDGTQALIEDVSCRAEDVERHLWKESPNAPCQITIKDLGFCR
jgi:hypothetical protein